MAPDYTVKKIDEMEAKGGGGFKLARHALGVQSFGLQIEDFRPNSDRYPEHDHTRDGQEEVYVVLRGSAEIEIDGERFSLDPETMARVGPEHRRRIHPGSQGARILAIGATPGKPYQVPEFSKPERVAKPTG